MGRYRRRRRFNPRFSTRPYLSNLTGANAITVPGRNVLPARLKTQFKMTYRAYVNYSAATGLSGVFNIKMNSLFDPTGSVGTLKPQMFNELMTYYNRYCVVGSYIKMTISNNGDIPITLYCSPVTNTTDTYSTSVCPQIPGTKYCTVEGLGSRCTKILTNYRNPSTVYGFPVMDNAFQAEKTADPNAVCWWHISFSPLQDAYDQDFDVNIFFETIYYTVLTNPRVVAFST